MSTPPPLPTKVKALASYTDTEPPDEEDSARVMGHRMVPTPFKMPYKDPSPYFHSPTVHPLEQGPMVHQLQLPPPHHPAPHLIYAEPQKRCRRRSSGGHEGGRWSLCGPSYVPLASLIALVISWLGLGFFSTKMYSGLGSIREIAETLFANLVPYLERAQMVAVGLGILMCLLTLAMAAVGFVATRNCHVYDRHQRRRRGGHDVCCTGSTGCNCRPPQPSRVRSIIGGRVACAVFVVLNALLQLLWLFILSFLVALLAIYLGFSPVCIPKAGGHPNQVGEVFSCFNFSMFTKIIAGKRGQNAAVNLVLCGEPVNQFCRLTMAILPWYWWAYGGCICVLFGLSNFSACLAANFAHVSRHAHGVYDRLHDDDYDRSHSCSRRSQRNGLLSHRRQLALAAQEIHHGRRQVGADGSPAPSSSGSSAGYGSTKLLVESYESSTSSPIPNGTVANNDNAASLCVVALDPKSSSILMCLLTLAMAAVGFVATRNCHVYDRHQRRRRGGHDVCCTGSTGCNCRPPQPSRVRSIIGGRVACAVFVVLNALLQLLWLFILSFLVALLAIYLGFSPVCIPKAGGHPNQVGEVFSCFNFSMFTKIIAGKRGQNAAVNLVLCGEPVNQFCRLTMAILPWYWWAYGGCICVLFGLSNFSACLAANFAHVSRHAHGVYDRLHDDDYDRSHSCSRRSQRNGLLSHRRQLALAAQEIHHGRRQVGADGSPAPSSSGSSAGYGSTKLLVESYESSTSSPIPNGTVANNDNAASLCVVALDPKSSSKKESHV